MFPGFQCFLNIGYNKVQENQLENTFNNHHFFLTLFGCGVCVCTGIGCVFGHNESLCIANQIVLILRIIHCAFILAY